ncbi:penicillin acylase family protein [Streptomyces carminius]|uniref:Penicillin acylase family protein n=1 Tax=Streptomyces carminius TaxID=2665496 RepID=A0A2M8M0K3_9ACTN|nr:penicillin acylase family protein [Streptomyces carminius]PJE97010.1 penicillin acylase family protein [Streptomyces carminius]PJE97719.1 penicillin acylase family protein [Streptomyces carminius]
MPAKKTSRRARFSVIAVVLLLVAGLGYGTYWGVDTVRASFPQTTGSLQLDGLSAPVTVKRDGHGIPQLYADSAEDLFRAQGYVHAQDRFWEMDVRRHLTAGRLSEMFGEDQVETDAFLRTLGWRKVAEEEYESKLSKTTKEYLLAYSEGVNSYLAERGGAELSLEYAALGFVNDYTPQKWTPVDSVAWLKAMAWDLRGNMQDEIDRALLAGRLEERQIEELYPDYPYERNKPIVREGAVDPAQEAFDPGSEAPSGGEADGDTGEGTEGSADGTGTGTGTQGAGSPDGVRTQLTGLSDVLDRLPALLGPNGNGIGSNSWVVHGKHTTTDKPLLANDPHLAPQLPSIWYQMGLHCNEVGEACPFDVAGFTFSGMPGVIIGHNQDISWGFTNLGADVTDLYLEKIEDGKYVYDGKRIPYETRQETIKVAGGKDRTITVRSTRHGPIVSDRSAELGTVGDHAPVGDRAPDRGKGYAVALRWTALEPSNTMDAVFKLNRAGDFEEFRAAAADFAVPSQNLLYADTEGNIGYQAPGRIPVRGKGDGRYPAPGWDPDHEWTGYIPQDELPWEYNPERGYIVTANQAVVDAEKYPYLLTEDWGYGARSRRIEDLIQSKIKEGGRVSTEDMATMQLDNSSEIAKILVPHLLRIDVKDPYVREAQELLEGWDYTQDADSAPAAYFNGVWRNLLKLSFGNKLPKEVRVEGECLRVRPADDSGPVEDLDGTVRTVRECGMRAPESAQPDGGDRWYEVVYNLLEKPDSGWWTPGSRYETGAGDRDELLADALRDARWELTTKLGKDIDTWSWGRLHRLMLKNQTLGTEGPGFVQHLLNRGPWNLGGGEAAVNATGWNAAGGYQVVWVPSMRMVVNMARLDESRWINLTGASGHAYHSNYIDQTDLWADGEMLDWPFGEEAVEKATEDKMALTPEP